MGNLESEVELLKYKVELLKFFIDDNKYPFFVFCLDNDITKKQEVALMKLLSIYNYRYKGIKNEFHQENIRDKDLKELLGSFNLKLEDLYVDSVPSYGEFQNHINSILNTEVKAATLLKKLIKQDIHEELCEYLLNDE